VHHDCKALNDVSALAADIKASVFISTEKSAMKYQRGVTSIEYALIASLIAMAIVGGVSAAGQANGAIWADWTEKVIAAVSRALP
jgi:pilus assembly protein Flp/PilA